MVADKPLLMGPIQTDEVYVGGRGRNKRANRKLRAGRGTVGKAPVIGSYDERTGQIWPEVVRGVDGPTVRMYFRNLVLPGTLVKTDQAAVYAEVPGTELRLAGTTTMEQAKAVLKQFLPRFQPAFPSSRPVP